MFDLNLIPLNYVDGKEQADMPGVYGAAAPRRAARGRAQEQLVIYVALQGTSPLSPTGLRQLLEKLKDVYFQTAGSVTAALRAAAEAMNSFLLDRNLRSTSAGRQAMGMLNLAAIHNDRLYLAQCGAVQAFLVAPQSATLYNDPQSASRGLGLTQTTPVRYYQTELAAGNYLVLCTNPPASWNAATLASSPAGSLDAIRRRLLSQAPTDLSAVLVQVLAGNGKVTQPPLAAKPPAARESASASGTIRPTGPVEPVPQVVVTPPAVTALAEAAVEIRPPTPAADKPVLPAETNQTEIVPPASPAAELQKKETTPSPAQASLPEPLAPPAVDKTKEAVSRPVLPVDKTPTAMPDNPARSSRTARYTSTASSSRILPGKSSSAVSAQDGEPVIQEMKRKRRVLGGQAGSIFLHGAGNFLRGVRAFRMRMGQLMRSIAARLLPGAGEQLPGLSKTTLIFIAIAVPVIVVAVALVVYNERGLNNYYQIYYDQALLETNQASGLKDTEGARAAWKDILAQLDKAESYKKTSDTQALRQQAWDALDKLDGLNRLDFQPIIAGNLGKDVNIVKVVANANDLYMLDKTQGRVFYAIRSSHGYELDPTFICGPINQDGQVRAGPLVDIAALPLFIQNKGTLGAVDANGNLVYCAPGAAEMFFQLKAPDIGWGQITALKFDNNILYVLDPKTNSIYYYTLTKGDATTVPAAPATDVTPTTKPVTSDNNNPLPDIDYHSQPQKLFTTPPAISDSVDMAIYGNEIYILHADGHLTECSYFDPNTAPTRCTDPAVFSDNRPVKDHNPTIFPGTAFSHILYTPPPDPSIYLLDANAPAIYHFSVKLNLQNPVLGARSALIYQQANPMATAFTISSNRIAFLAWGNQVYYAFVP